MKYYRLSLDSLLELIRQGRADVAQKAADEVRARITDLEDSLVIARGQREYALGLEHEARAATTTEDKRDTNDGRICNSG
jgi:hypothetical protein